MGKAIGFEPAARLLFVILVMVFFQFVPNDALAVEPICPGGTNPDPNVIWCDDFEDGSWLDTWNVSPCCDRDNDKKITKEEMEAVICGRKGYRDNCAVWNERYNPDGYGGFDGHHGSVNIPFPETFYIRWYVYISHHFKWGTVQDKNLRIMHFIDPDKGIKSISITVKTNLFGKNRPEISEFSPVDKNFFQNRNPLTLQPGRWYLFEWYVELNTQGLSIGADIPDLSILPPIPEISNGITRLWVDDATVPIDLQTLVLEYTNINFRITQDKPTVLQLTAYHGNDIAPDPRQNVRWDNIVVSRTPIGPMIVEPDDPPIDVTPPSPPQSLKVQ